MSETNPTGKEGNDNLETLHHFDDGRRRIDYILAYSTDHIEGEGKNEKAVSCFKNYLDFLEQNCGLEWEKIKNTWNEGNSDGEVVEKSSVSFIKVRLLLFVIFCKETVHK